MPFTVPDPAAPGDEMPQSAMRTPCADRRAHVGPEHHGVTPLDLPLGDQVQRWIGETYRLMGMQERLNRR